MKIIPAPPVEYDLSKLNLVGFLTLAIGVGGFLLWSLLTPLNSAVVAQGSIQVLSQNKQIQHLEGGIVEEIFVHENQEVSAGEVLLRLDQTFAGAEHHRLLMQMYELEIREALLLAKRDMKSEFDLPEISDERLPEGWLDDQSSTAVRLYNLALNNLQSELAIADKRLSQLKQQARGLERERQAKVSQLGFMEDEIESWKGMVEKKLANKLRFLEIQSEAAELRGIIAKTEAQQAEVQVKIGEVELERLQAQQQFQEQAATELRDIQFSLKDVREQLATSANILRRVDIRAPVDGTVTGLKVQTLGAVVKPGDLIMEIVPVRETLIVESRISPTDVDKVYKGMDARVRLASFKQHEMPELLGLVESVSADVFEDERAQTQYYVARIALNGVVGEDAEQADQSIGMQKIQPGMPTEVMIITGNSTPAQYLMEPLLNSFNRAWRDS
jgi:HlyD family type I secretion membrane fusion protein